MPATAGRVRMPANNRVHSSAALQTHGIWQSAIGYDPYAPNKDDSKNSTLPKASSNEPDADNPYNSYQGLLALARITNTNADEARGACRKCGRVGHLTFQCRNFLSVKEDAKEKDAEAIQAAVLSELGKIKGKVGKFKGKGKGESEDDSDEDEDEESDSSDSDADSVMERIIASRFGKKVSNKGRSSRKKKRDDSDENGSDSDSDSGKRKKRGRSKKRRSGKRGHSDSEDEYEGKRKTSRKRGHSDSEDEDKGKRKRRRERRSKRDKSSDEENEREHRRRKSRKEKRRRRSDRLADDSDLSASEDSGGRYERKSQRSVTLSDFDASGSDDSRVGRGAKRSTKNSRKRRHRDNE